MDPLQFLHKYQGKEVAVDLAHGERLHGVLVAADEHGNVVLQDVSSSFKDGKDEEEGQNINLRIAKRPRSFFHGAEKSVRLIRGSVIKAISSFC